jgi:multidrug efflux pump subunit AcrA (membrane-fusion protein)
MRRRTAQVVPCLALAAVLVAGCGGGSDYANEPRPAAPIVVTASISKQAVSVSPKKFGAGPITLIVTNQTSASQQLTLEVNSGQAGFKGRTGPINPRDTGQLKADLVPGKYLVHVDGGSIRAAKLNVGAKRPSAQNDLLQP